jgi:hypothetical protein
MRRRAEGGGEEGLYRRLLAVGTDRPRIRALLDEAPFDDVQLLALLRRAVPAAFLEELGRTPPWSDHPRMMGAIVTSPRCPGALALRLVPSLFWSDLVVVAGTPRVASAVRNRAEALLCDLLPEMRLGERMTLAKRAPTRVLRMLLGEGEARVLEAALINPRLREEDLLAAIRDARATPALFEAIAASFRWRESYAVRLALVLQPRTPLGIALSQITSLVPRDLRRVSETRELRPLLQAAARRAAEPRSGDRSG